MNVVKNSEVDAVMGVSILLEVIDARAQWVSSYTTEGLAKVSIYTAEELAWVIMNLLEIILTKCGWLLLKMVYHLPLL